jgi:hypothetical protein
MTTPSLEARVAHVEGIVGQVDTRLARMETRLDDSVGELRGGITSLRQEIRADMTSFRQEVRSDTTSFRHEVRTDITSLRQEGRQNFQWTLGILLGMWVTIILAILVR